MVPALVLEGSAALSPGYYVTTAGRVQWATGRCMRHSVVRIWQGAAENGEVA